MRLPDLRRGIRAHMIAIAALITGAGADIAAQDIPEALGDAWYRTELLVFIRDDTASRTAQQFDPLPSLAYPADFRYLIDPEMADRRLAESQAFISEIDSVGRQHLTVPAPVEAILDHNRPDALIQLSEELPPVSDPNATAIQPDAVSDPNIPLLPDASAGELLPLDANEPVPDPNSPVLALPYELLDSAQLSFASQARSLRRQGHRIVFHGSWWAQLSEDEEPLPLVLDRASDMDTPDWPALQGSVRVYRSRFLHADVDLWLNTMGDYLSEGWQIPAPPLALPSLSSESLAGQTVNPWRPPELLPMPSAPVFQGLAPGAAEAQPLDPNEAHAATDADEAATNYPWHHAIVHRQSRRMRSGEIHYLDHPVIGVIVRITPAAEDDLPLLPARVIEFRERHALPVERLVMETESEVAP